MKLLTKRDTDSVFYDITGMGSKGMDAQLFNEAVNRILYDKQLTNLILIRVKKLLVKLK